MLLLIEGATVAATEGAGAAAATKGFATVFATESVGGLEMLLLRVLELLLLRVLELLLLRAVAATKGATVAATDRGCYCCCY